MKDILSDSIRRCISGWDKEGIYAVSLFVYDNSDNPCEPTVTLGYNTEEHYLSQVTLAADAQEARWNYAFWLQNCELVFGTDATQEIVRQWIEESGFAYFSYSEVFGKNPPDMKRCEGITDAFVAVLIDIVKELHSSGFIGEQFGRTIPVIIHELEYYKAIGTQNLEANPPETVRDFAAFCGLHY